MQADASPGSPTGAHGRGPRLYVGGVPDEITEEDIVEHFNKWGQVVDCYFPGANDRSMISIHYAPASVTGITEEG